MEKDMLKERVATLEAKLKKCTEELEEKERLFNTAGSMLVLRVDLYL